MPLLGILDRFQEGRSHMAIVSRLSVEKAASVKKVVKRGLTQRLRDRVRMGDTDSSSSSSDDEDEKVKVKERKKTKKTKLRDVEKALEGETAVSDDDMDGEATLKGDGTREKDFTVNNKHSTTFSGRGRSRGIGKGVTSRQQSTDLEMGPTPEDKDRGKRRGSFAQLELGGLEQMTPADAVLAKEDAEEVTNQSILREIQILIFPSSCKGSIRPSCHSVLSLLKTSSKVSVTVISKLAPY